MSKTKTSASLGLLLAFTFLSGIVISSPRAEAGTSVISNITLDIPITCAITPTDHTHSISIEPGHDAVIGSSTFTVTCNDAAGYSVYAVGYTNNTYGETNLVHNSNNSFVIPTGASASPTDSQWNMTLAPVAGIYAPEVVNVANGDNFTVPHVIPSTYTKVVYREESTDINTDDYTAVGSSFTAQYNLHVSSNQAAGLYTGKVKYTLVHPNTAVAYPDHTVTLSLGAGIASITIDGVSYSDGDTLSLYENSTYAISAALESNYEFDSWSVSGSGTTIGSTSAQNTTITVGTTDFSLAVSARTMQVTFDDAYAAAGKTKLNGYYKMQDMNDGICSTVTGNQTGTLIDTRDGSTYTVAKLVDNASNPTYSKCWMTQNLRLDFSSSILAGKTVATLQSATNNPASGFWAAAKGAAASNQGFNSSDIDTVKYSKVNIGDNTKDSTNHAYNDYGIYYNWYTATAGHGTQIKTSSDGSMPGDICPSGWRLPTIGYSTTAGSWINTGDFEDLNVAINYGSDSDPSNLVASPVSFLYSGAIINSNAVDRGAIGLYWGSAADTDSNALCFDIEEYYITTAIDGKERGYAVRCLADAASNQGNNQQSSPSNTPTNNQQSASPTSTSGTDGTKYLATTSSSVDEEDETKSENSTNGNITPLGVKKSNTVEETGSIIGGGSADAGVFGTVAAIGAAALVTGGIFLLAAKRRKDEDEEEE